MTGIIELKKPDKLTEAQMKARVYLFFLLLDLGIKSTIGAINSTIMLRQHYSSKAW
jgi:hypothetical protein